jgi:O-antigen/teichoic acid export membrane protein
MAAQPHSSTTVHGTGTRSTLPTTRWSWAILTPYAVIAVVGIPLALFGDMDQLPSPRSLVGLVFLLSAVLARVALYKDIRSVRTASQQWSPRYWWYALGGALVLLGGLFILDASVSGGIVGAVIPSLVLGVVLSIPAYLGRRYAASQPTDR